VHTLIRVIVVVMVDLANTLLMCIEMNRCSGRQEKSKKGKI